MPTASGAAIAIVDYGLGNLYSVKHACHHVGVAAEITSSREEILRADAAILPGVGAFGDAMATLHRLDLVGVLRDFVSTGRPLLGVCLGMQLLMSESEEFGAHKGLGIVGGTVTKIAAPTGHDALKVPQIGWNAIYRYPRPQDAADPWSGTLLEHVADGEPMYFVHSYVVQPANAATQLSRSSYGAFEFCSSIQYRNVTACQFHPERSGPRGLRIYQTLADRIRKDSKENVRE